METCVRKGMEVQAKTDFIRQWWESADEVTLITRPRRFGKTLNMSMLEHYKWKLTSRLFTISYP